MKQVAFSIAALLGISGPPLDTLACGLPTDTLCGVIEWVESVDLGPDQAGVALHGPFAYGQVSCSFHGENEQILASGPSAVYLACDSDDSTCMDGIDKALAGQLAGEIALFTGWESWGVNLSTGFPDFVSPSDDGAQFSDHTWDFQAIQYLSEEFAETHRICQAATQWMEPDEWFEGALDAPRADEIVHPNSAPLAVARLPQTARDTAPNLDAEQEDSNQVEFKDSGEQVSAFEGAEGAGAPPPENSATDTPGDPASDPTSQFNEAVTEPGCSAHTGPAPMGLMALWLVALCATLRRRVDPI